jgi:copper chaperone
MITEEISIQGMTCGGCVSSIQRVFGQLPLRQFAVQIGAAEVSYDDAEVTREQIDEAIENAGFKVVANGGSTQF